MKMKMKHEMKENYNDRNPIGWISPYMFSVFFLFSSFCFADLKAELYEKGSSKTKKLFILETKDQQGSELKSIHTESIYKDMNNEIALIEKSTLNKENSDLIQFEVDQKQLATTATVVVQNDQILFTKTVRGETKKASEKLRRPLVISANFQRFVRSRWTELTSGKKIDIRFAVWDRMETVGFSLFQSGKEKIGSDDTIIITMKPTNFIIAALVDPIQFYFKLDGSALVQMIGRVAPKIKKGKDWKDLDAEVYYFP